MTDHNNSEAASVATPSSFSPFATILSASSGNGPEF
jgi:hypothetical protein